MKHVCVYASTCFFSRRKNAFRLLPFTSDIPWDFSHRSKKDPRVWETISRAKTDPKWKPSIDPTKESRSTTTVLLTPRWLRDFTMSRFHDFTISRFHNFHDRSVIFRVFRYQAFRYQRFGLGQAYVRKRRRYHRVIVHDRFDCFPYA